MNDDTIIMSREPIHPGEFLREDYMPELGLSVAGLAERLGVTRQTVNDIVRERRGLSPRHVPALRTALRDESSILDEHAGKGRHLELVGVASRRNRGNRAHCRRRMR